MTQSGEKSAWKVFKDWLVKLGEGLLTRAKENRLILLGLSAYILLHTQIEDLLNQQLVLPLLSKISSKEWPDVIFGCIGLLIIVDFVFKWRRRYQLSLRTALPSVVLLGLYLYYRVGGHRWDFKGFSFWDTFKYLDVLMMYFGGYVVLYGVFNKKISKVVEFILYFSINKMPWIKNLFDKLNNLVKKQFNSFNWLFDLLNSSVKWIQSQFSRLNNLVRCIQSQFAEFKKTDPKTQGFFVDEPTQDDKLKRKNMVTTLCDILDKTTSTAAFAVGISGEWGYGKTSFLRLVKKEMSEKNHIVIDFNPWLNHEAKTITKDFFDTLRTKLADYSDELSPMLKRYAEQLTGAGNSQSDKLFAFILKSYQQDQSLAAEFEAIQKAISRLDRKVIVFIDDIDRLYKEEIMQVFKLIRNSANFANMYFVVAYDKGYVVNAIKDLQEEKSIQYLEKIFQVEINLPKIDKLNLKKLLMESMSFLNKEDEKKIENYLLENIRNENPGSFNIFDYPFLYNARSIKRVTNSFLIVYSQMETQIDAVDLLLIEIVRLRYPDIYSLLFFETNKLLTLQSEDTYHYITENDITKKHDHGKKLGQLLNHLFSREHSNNIHFNASILHISNITGYRKYFHYQLVDTDIKIADIKNYLKDKNIEECKNKIDNNWEKEYDFYRICFRSIEYFEEKEFLEKIINLMLYTSGKAYATSRNFSESNLNYNPFHADLVNKIFYHGDNYKIIFPSIEDHKNTIIRIMSEAKSPYLTESYVITYIMRSKNLISLKNHPVLNDIDIIMKDLIDMRMRYLKKYLEEIDIIDDNIIHLSYLNSDFIEGRYIPNMEVKKIIYDFWKEKYFYRFITDVLKKEIIEGMDLFTLDLNNHDVCRFLKNITIINELDRLIQDLFKERPEDKLLQEIRVFYHQWKNNNSQPIPFSFKHLKLPPDPPTTPPA